MLNIAKASATIRIGGQVLPVHTASVVYGINTIPSATVGIVLGRNRTGIGSGGSEDYDAYNGEEISITIKDKKIFEGFVEVGRLTKSYGQVSLEIQALHWTHKAFNVTSAMSAGFTPSAAVSVGAVPLTFAAAGLGSTNIFSSMGMANYCEQYHNENLGRWIATVIDRVFSRASTTSSGGLGSLDNAELRSYLSRLVGDTNFAVDTTEAKNTISQTLSEALAGGILQGGNTVWQTLINLGGLFRFVLVPTCDKLWIVPYAPVVRTSSYDTTVCQPRNVFAATVTSAPYSQRLGGMMVMSANAARNQGDTGTINNVQARDVVYIMDPQRPIEATVAPGWLDSIIYAGMASYMYGNGVPGQRSPEQIAAAYSTSPAEAAKLTAQLRQQYQLAHGFARSMVADTLAAGSINVVTDFNTVGPGSLLRVSLPTQGGWSRENVYGYASQVSYHISSSPPSLNTSIMLSSVHSGDIADLPGGSPLYTKLYKKSDVAADSFSSDGTSSDLPSLPDAAADAVFAPINEAEAAEKRKASRTRLKVKVTSAQPA